MTAASAIIWGPDRSTHLKSMSYRITDGDGLLISLHPIGNVTGLIILQIYSICNV